MQQQIDLPNISIITISGRIGSGSTTLAKKLAEKLGWKHLEGGEIFWEAVRKKMGLEPKDTHLRPDEEDQLFDDELKRILTEEKHIILESKLAGFNAWGAEGVFKILMICEDEKGNDKSDIRVDRLMNREKLSADEAKEEIVKREKSDLEKWRKMYANNDPYWVYWDKKYYNLIINTYSHNQEETLKIALEAIGYKD